MPFTLRPYRFRSGVVLTELGSLCRFPVRCAVSQNIHGGRQTIIAAIFVRMILICMAAISLAGCISGTVSTASYSDPPQQATFIVLSSDSSSRTERRISALIEDKMSARGYRQATSLGVRYKYSVDPGSVTVDSNGQADWEFPRHFQIAVIDLQKSKMPEKIEVLWQGEVSSIGTSTNMFLLASVFIDALFENYGETVTNKSFRK